MAMPNGQFRVVFTPKLYEASLSFYRDGLSLPVDHEWDYGGGDRGVVFLAAAGMIELLGAVPGAPFKQPQGITVLIQVDDVDHWHRLALERGLPVAQEPTSFPWGQRVLRLTDPDGLTVALFSPI
jgi:predicted enzyme related to lactoylglutathione lyase